MVDHTDVCRDRILLTPAADHPAGLHVIAKCIQPAGHGWAHVGRTRRIDPDTAATIRHRGAGRTVRWFDRDRRRFRGHVTACSCGLPESHWGDCRPTGVPT